MTRRRGGLPPFDANAYRKRVLAVVHKRGGPDTSDAFELYDVPVADAERLGDPEVAAQVAEVWAFWQRQRDHPKYGTLATLLVEGHDERSAPLLDRHRRVDLAARIVAERDRRDAERFALLDQAIRRLVERHRGVPRDKVDGLVEVGALGGLTADEVRARLRHHRLVDAVASAPLVAAAAPSSVGDHRRQQIRDLLDEFGRLQEVPPPPTLLALLGLEPHSSSDEIARRAEAWRVRCRELPPSRVRAVADELLVHIHDLLEAGRPVLESYLDVVALDVTDRLRPRVRAAVLVEDRLVADDHEHLFTEALAQGLDPARARAVLAAIAGELGVPIEPFDGGARPTSTRPVHAGRAWEQPLRAARQALRDGRLVAGRRLVGEAASGGDPAGTTPIRAVADEIDDAIREAELRWRAVATAVGARRFAEALEHLEHLVRTANDVPSPSGSGRADAELDRARREVAAADEQVALALASADPPAELVRVLDTWPGHPAAVAALAAVPLDPPTAVRAVRERGGAVVVSWSPSATAGVTYRVARLQPDGTPRVIARTVATGLENGGAPAGPLPDYVVVPVRAGRSSAEAGTRASEPVVPVEPVTPVATPAPPVQFARAAEPVVQPPPVQFARKPRPAQTPAAPPEPTPAPPSLALAAPSGVSASRTTGGAVLVRWTGPADAEFKVSRQAADGRWQVVGRTRATTLEDGGAPPGPPPSYTVAASRDGAVSPEAHSG